MDRCLKLTYLAAGGWSEFDGITVTMNPASPASIAGYKGTLNG